MLFVQVSQLMRAWIQHDIEILCVDKIEKSEIKINSMKQVLIKLQLKLKCRIHC